MVFFFFASHSIPAQTISMALVAPMDVNGLSARLAEEDFRPGDIGRAARFDLWFPTGNAGNASLTMAETSFKNLWVGGGVLSLPSIDLEFSFSPCTIPFFAEGIKLDQGLLSASFMVATVFAPLIGVEAFSMPFTIASAQAFYVSGELGYDGSSVGFFGAEGGGSIRSSGNENIGDLSGSVGGISLDLGGWGLLYGSAQGEANVTIKSFLSLFFPSLPWAAGNGTADLQFAAAWGSLRLGGPQWTAGVEAAAGFFWSQGISANARIIQNGVVTANLSWPFGIQSAGLVLVHPSLTWVPMRGLRIGIGRWLPFSWVEPSTPGATGAPSSVSSAVASIESLSLETILLSGLEMTASCTFY